MERAVGSNNHHRNSNQIKNFILIQDVEARRL